MGPFCSRIMNMYYAYPLLRFPKVHMAFVYVFCGFDLGMCTLQEHGAWDLADISRRQERLPHLDSASDWVKQTFNQPEALHRIG